MLKYTDYDVVFQEIPDEVTLAVNIAGCPNRCPGCHSPQLQQEIGEPLTPAVLAELLERYGDAVTCLCLMGGDGDPAEVARLAAAARTLRRGLRTAWYSGCAELPPHFPAGTLDYVKLGPYVAALGGLRSPRPTSASTAWSPTARAPTSPGASPAGDPRRMPPYANTQRAHRFRCARCAYGPPHAQAATSVPGPTT